MQASEASASTAAAHGGAFASGHTPASAAGGAAAARSRAPRRRCRHQRRLHAQLLDLGVLVGGHEALVGARDLLELLLRLLAVVCGRRATGGWVGGGKPAGPWERTAQVARPARQAGRQAAAASRPAGKPAPPPAPTAHSGSCRGASAARACGRRPWRRPCWRPAASPAPRSRRRGACGRSGAPGAWPAGGGKAEGGRVAGRRGAVASAGARRLLPLLLPGQPALPPSRQTHELPRRSRPRTSFFFSYSLARCACFCALFSTASSTMACAAAHCSSDPNSCSVAILTCGDGGPARQGWAA